MRRFILGIFTEEDKLLKATKAIREKSIKVHDVYTPYVVHGLDDVMGIRRSRLPYVTFATGLLGATLAIAFQVWVFTKDWPMIIGGKPYNSLPAFIPVVFEVTVLTSGVLTALAFFLRSRLIPRFRVKLFDKAITDDRFIIAIEKSDASFDDEMLKNILNSSGAHEVREEVVL